MNLQQIAREFVDYWTGATEANHQRSGLTGAEAERGCGMCGGVPHSTTCFVGRFQAALAAPDAAAQDAPLEAVVKDGVLTVRIGIHALAHAVTYSDWANPWNDDADDNIRSFAIVDALQFAKDVTTEMLAEAEDGSSPLTRFIDQVSEEAVNQGSLGLHDEDVVIRHGQTSPLEAWANK